MVQVKQTYLWLVEACEPPTYKPGTVVKDEWQLQYLKMGPSSGLCFHECTLSHFQVLGR